MKPVTSVPKRAWSIFSRGISLTLMVPKSEKQTPSPNEQQSATI